MDEVSGLSKKPTDPWSGDHIGFFNTLGAVSRSGPHKGKRSYAARGYFQANACRPNLKVLCEAQVNKIVLENGVAKGVEFVYHGMNETVYSKKEVILCGGVINSPQILELSGIGDPRILEQAGVECKVKLPGVGENLQDHACAVLGLDLKPGTITMDILGDPQVMEAAGKALVETQSGPLTSIVSTQGFLPTNFKLLPLSSSLLSKVFARPSNCLLPPLSTNGNCIKSSHISKATNPPTCSS
ncbi:unnamed protein product [Aureobasidium pullulans]|nr:unnamed protein product [Aureobasidium pullulans]